MQINSKKKRKKNRIKVILNKEKRKKKRYKEVVFNLHH